MNDAMDDAFYAGIRAAKPCGAPRPNTVPTQPRYHLLSDRTIVEHCDGIFVWNHESSKDRLRFWREYIDRCGKPGYAMRWARAIKRACPEFPFEVWAKPYVRSAADI